MTTEFKQDPSRLDQLVGIIPGFIKIVVDESNPGSNSYVYIGYAKMGSLRTDPVWLIARTGLNVNGETETSHAYDIATGNITFNQVWDLHTGLVYK